MRSVIGTSLFIATLAVFASSACDFPSGKDDGCSGFRGCIDVEPGDSAPDAADATAPDAALDAADAAADAATDG